MRIAVVADVHGNAEALARAGDRADAVIVLGDLIDFVDYADHRAGILGRIFGPEIVGRFASIRTHGRPGELRRYAESLWARLADPQATLEDAVREQYARLFDALSAPAYLTPGNVDLPHLWPEFLTPGLRMLDGEVVEIGGLRFGFVGGLPVPAHLRLNRQAVWRPYVRPDTEYAAAAAALTGIDVLCSHVPPRVPELAYDVVTRRAEVASADLLRVIDSEEPRAALFGHVHQPLAARARVRRTECVNVGHFRRTERPYLLTW